MNYIVQPGESMYQLADRFHTSLEAILSANKLANPELTYPGQLLSIPAPVGLPTEGTEYIVQPEDSLYEIAVRYHVPMRELIQANHITVPYLIYAGQSLILPGISAS
jgi:LysM repeat protein